MKLSFTARGSARLAAIQVYLEDHSGPRVAARVIAKLRRSAEMLTDHPRLGTEWRGGPTRALVVSGLPYRLHYRIAGETIVILTITHTRQRPPRL